MKDYKIGLLGLGIVGSAFIKNLHQSPIGKNVKIEKILVSDPNKPRDIPYAQSIITADFNELINDHSIDILIELIGGVEPAYSYIKNALYKKIPVITANKNVIALYGKELISLAIKHRTPLLFEASVGGGIPIVRTIIDNYNSINIKSIYAIANGTSNYILSEISENKIEFSKALEQAQQAGYAELDPSLDIEGYDAMYKNKILASLCFKDLNILTEQVSIYQDGIICLNKNDIIQAEKLGYKVKPMVIAEKINNKIFAATITGLVPNKNIVSDVGGVNNIFLINSNSIDRAQYIGPGAGGDVTAASVLEDLQNLISNHELDLNYYESFNSHYELEGIDTKDFKFYINFSIDFSLDNPASIPDNSLKSIHRIINEHLDKYNLTTLNCKYSNNELESAYTHIIIIIDHCRISEVVNLSNSLNNKYNINKITYLPIFDQI